MSKKSLSDIARYFCVSDIPGATIPSARLSSILEHMFNGRPLTGLSLKYLQEQHLTELHLLATGEIDYETFVEASGQARKSREQAAEAERLVNETKLLAREAEWARKFQAEREAAAAARIARESDPKYVARKKNQALRKKYGIGFIEEPLFPHMMHLLKQIDSGSRLTEDDILWLNTAGKEYFTDELRNTYHLREGEFFAGELQRTKDPWSAVNASGHFRKCDQSARALEILDSAPQHRLNDSKIISAVCTTRGGVMRDLGRLSDAHQLGEQAHEFVPRDFRPCTLLGAVNMELGNFEDAREWYAKAEERGASHRAIDSELRRIFMRADMTKRDAIKAFLLAEDPVRYAWANGKP